MNGPAGQLMTGIFEIAIAIIGVALFALLLNKNSNTTQVVSAVGSQFTNALDVITLQSGTNGALYR